MNSSVSKPMDLHSCPYLSRCGGCAPIQPSSTTSPRLRAHVVTRYCIVGGEGDSGNATFVYSTGAEGLAEEFTRAGRRSMADSMLGVEEMKSESLRESRSGDKDAAERPWRCNEKLALMHAVLKHGDQAWTAVSRAMRSHFSVCFALIAFIDDIICSKRSVTKCYLPLAAAPRFMLSLLRPTLR